MKTTAHITSIAAFVVAARIVAADAGDATALSQQGWQLLQSGKAADAVAKFKEAVQIAPKDAAALNGLGWATFNSGQAVEAERMFEQVIAIAPDHAAALNGLGQIYLSRRDYAKAEPVLLKSAKQKAPAAWYGLARLYLLQGKFADAEKWAQMVEDSGQGDETAKKMLEAAKAKILSDGLRATIETQAPADSKNSAEK